VLLRATCGVQGNADKDEYDRKHDDGSDGFHGYSFPI
jgi:hypothetical protein